MTLEECLRLYGEALSESEMLWLRERADSPEIFEDLAGRLRGLEAERDNIIGTIGEHYEQTVGQEGVKEPTQEEIGLQTRTRVEEGLKSTGRYTEPQIDAYMELWDSIGRSWAEHSGRDPAEWYQSWLVDVRPEQFEQMIIEEGLLYQGDRLDPVKLPRELRTGTADPRENLFDALRRMHALELKHKAYDFADVKDKMWKFYKGEAEEELDVLSNEVLDVITEHYDHWLKRHDTGEGWFEQLFDPEDEQGLYSKPSEAFTNQEAGLIENPSWRIDVRQEILDRIEEEFPSELPETPEAILDDLDQYMDTTDLREELEVGDIDEYDLQATWRETIIEQEPEREGLYVEDARYVGEILDTEGWSGEVGQIVQEVLEKEGWQEWRANWPGELDAAEGRIREAKERLDSAQSISEKMIAINLALQEQHVYGSMADHMDLSDEELTELSEMGDQIKDFRDLLRRDYRFYQKGKRGAVEFLGEHGPAIMSLFEAADASTPIHETGHILLEMLRERQDADWTTVTGWLEADPTKPLSRKHKEQFAKGFEAYVMEGKSPSFKMREVFARLREWMLRIYRGIRGLNVKINDKVRDVFDRLVAREAERMKDPIDDAAEWIHVDEVQEPIELGPDPQYEALQAEARRRATLRVKQLKEKRDRKIAADFKKEAKETIAEIPVYSAMDELVKLGGLNHEAVLRDWGQEDVTALMRKRPGIVAKKGTIYPDIFAADSGFESDDAMIMAMMDAPTKAEAVDKYMLELYDQYEEYIETDDADLYLRTIDEEIKILRDLTKRFKPTTAKGIKGVIRRETGQVKLSNLISEHDALKGAMEKTARAARDAYRAGRKEATLELKESQRTLAIQRREMARAKKEATAIRERLKKLLKLSTKDKKVDLEYRERLRDFLSEFDLVAMTDRSRRRLESRQEWLDRKGAEGEVEITNILRSSIDRLNKIPWTELTLPELREIEAAAQMIAQLGRKKNELLGRKKAREVETSAQRILDSIDKHWGDIKGPLQDPLADGKLISGLKLWNQYHAELKAAEFIFRRLDGFEDMGPVWDEAFLPIKEAEDWENTLGPQVQAAIQKAFAPFAEKRSATKRWLTEVYRIEGLDQPFAKVGSKSPMTKDKIISAALNVGTEGNRQALVEGYGWSEENLANILDHLTKEEWQLVRDIWDTFDISWPFLAEQYRKLTGARLPKVDGILVQTKFGVIQGKYYPLVPHRKLSRRMDRLATQAEYRDFFRHQYTVPAARTGSVFERTGTKLPPELAISVAFRKHVENIHYLTHVLAVRDVNKILSDPRVEQRIIETQGEAIYNQLKPWLQEVARPRREPLSAVEASLDFLRRNTTVVALGLKLTVAQKQALSLTQTMNEVGFFPTMAAVSSFWSNPLTMRAKMEWVNQRSPQMDQRRHKWDRELADAYRRFDLSLVSGSKGARDAYFSLIGFVDAMAVYPTWMAAYTEGLKKYAWEWKEAKPGTVSVRTFDSLEQKAVEYADAIVRKTQPAASPKDLAEIQRGGPGRRMLTMFYTFFSRMQNMWMENKGKYRLGKINAAQFARATWYIWIMPVVLAMSGAAIRERRKPELSEFARNLMLYKIGGLPYARDFISPWFSGHEYTMSPVAGAGKSFERLVGEATRKQRGEKLLKYFIEGGGYVFGYPGRQFSITALGMIDLLEGRTDDPSRLAYPPPYKRR